MNEDIIKRRKQVFNTFRANSTVLESENSALEIKEASNLSENAESLNICMLSDNVDDPELNDGTSAEGAADNIVTLNDENGSEIRFEFLDLITYRKREYIVLLPIDGETDQVVILQVESVGPNEESYISVDNEYTLEAVFSLFKERNQHEFDFID